MRVLNIALIFLALVLSVGLVYATYIIHAGFTLMRQATEQYIVCQQDAAAMQSGSDYLTEQVRSFAVTGDRTYMDNYFREAEVTRRREISLEELGGFLSGTEAYTALSAALDLSNELMEKEYYSMRLVADSQGWPEGEMPAALRAVLLAPEDRALPAEEKVRLATDLVFNEAYQEYKQHISGEIDQCLDTLINETREQQLSSSDRLFRLLPQQYTFIGLLLMIVLVLVLVTMLLVVRPLEKSIARIENHLPLEVSGAYELKFLARTYNTMYERSQENQNKLSYEATHDALTGLFNRGYFDKLRSSADLSNSTLLLIDLDRFKEINDTYGHETGDMALKKVAELLQDSFRAEDFVCRIGGDEFAVIMVHTSSALRELVGNKIAALNKKLLAPGDGLPTFSLSVGVAFGDRPNPGEDMFKDADAALYQVKNNGRGGCAFYE